MDLVNDLPVLQVWLSGGFLNFYVKYDTSMCRSFVSLCCMYLLMKRRNDKKQKSLDLGVLFVSCVSVFLVAYGRKHVSL